MSDRLGEALSHELGIEAVILSSAQDDYLLDPFETIVAAARNWHTLTNHDEAMVDRAADALIRRQFLQSKPHILDQIVSTYTDKTAYREDAHAVFDALSVTPTPEDDDASIH